MTQEQRDKLLEIRKRGKTAKNVSLEEHIFCEEMFSQYPKEYGEVEHEMQEWLHHAPWWELL